MTRQVDNWRAWDTTMAPARAGCHDAHTDWAIRGTASTLSTYYVPGNVLKGFTIVTNLILTTNLLGLTSFYRWGNCSSEKLANQFISGRSLMWPRAMWLQSLGSSSLPLTEEVSGTWAEVGRRRCTEQGRGGEVQKTSSCFARGKAGHSNTAPQCAGIFKISRKVNFFCISETQHVILASEQN